MITYERPVVCVSKCLGFESCRYNGSMSPDSLVDKMKNHVTFITVCPECEIGLPTPRETLRIVKENGELHLVQPKLGADYTLQMKEFSSNFLRSLLGVDGFILKGRSPSCGIRDVKIYASLSKGASSEKGNGFFGAAILNNFQDNPAEDDGRLSNYKIRENFLTKLFLFSRFRKVKESNSMEELLKFHNMNKLLLMSFNQKELKELGRIAANHEQVPVEEVLKYYEKHLKLAVSRSARYTSNINVLQHAIGHFSKFITENERVFLIDSLEKYKGGNLPLSAPLYLVKSHAVRFNLTNLLNQSYFDPYPFDLMELRDSGKGIN